MVSSVSKLVKSDQAPNPLHRKSSWNDLCHPKGHAFGFHQLVTKTHRPNRQESESCLCTKYVQAMILFPIDIPYNLMLLIIQTTLLVLKNKREQ